MASPQGSSFVETAAADTPHPASAPFEHFPAIVFFCFPYILICFREFSLEISVITKIVIKNQISLKTCVVRHNPLNISKILVLPAVLAMRAKCVND